jgi:hypothetical protein
MSRVSFAVALAVLLIQGGCATAASALELVLPRAPLPGEQVVILVEVGRLGGAGEIEVATSDGRLLGVVSPYAVRAGQAAGTYTIPVAAERMDGDRIVVRLRVTSSHQAAHPPSADEVLSVRAVIAADAGEGD